MIILLQEVAETIKNSMDSFVVHLLLRLFEPGTATSRLAHYSRYVCTLTSFTCFTISIDPFNNPAHSDIVRLSFLRPSDPEPPLPHFPSVAVRATLDYIASCYGTPAAALGPSTSFIKQLARRTVSIVNQMTKQKYNYCRF